MKHIVRYFSITCVLLFAALIAFEGWALWRAEAHTPNVVAKAIAAEHKLPESGLSPEQLDILLKVEDPGFEQHKGVDFSSPGQGMTTITQGLVKLFYFDKFKPGFAKIEQSLIARFVLNRHLTKQQQLALFLEHAYFGHDSGTAISGFAQASQHYFAKPLDQLNRDEYIGLVALLIGPNRLHPVRNKESHQARVMAIKMLLDGQCEPDGVFDPWYRNCKSP